MVLAEINSVGFGSTGKIMLQVADLARKNGAEAYCFVPRTKKQKQIEGITYFGNIYSRILSNKLSLYAFAGRTAFYDTLDLLKMLDKIKPDIIHLHNLHKEVVNLPMIFNYIKKRNIRVFWTLHDCWSFTGHCPHFEVAKCDKWKTGCYKCIQYHLYPQSKVDQSKRLWKLKKKWFTGVKNMTIVTPSDWLANLVKQSYLSEYPVKVINNGIDLSIFKPTESDFRQRYGIEDKYVVLGVAFGWGERKGLDVFKELAARLDGKYQFVLVGTDDNVDKQLPENIISIHRTLNQIELAEIYTAADVFFNPTREEVLGMVNVEALACGTPVVTFNTGGSPECIDETCGIVIPKNDIDAAERAIVSVCDGENKFNSEMCIKRAQKFDMNEKFSEYIKLYGLL